MDRIGAIDRLAAVLQDAGAREDWELLGRAVRELGPRLQRLAAGRPWSAPERAALTRLRAAHEGAALQVAAASGRLQAQLEHMGSNKEGWMAYALADEPETGNTL
ncbi:hypothetical protein LQ564_14270 [Massilia sp. G4R7]|uniref:Flagellar protein FliT n=1 Tax=Massilia phyllostachyos TaxID=2898585 RepID=A0ABS8Q6U1_9BURK|nr:hypothetical protein [Massilia phyllostachyos]MCD2517476.1 hypothetical protein [Massilia phyllostachyos]